MKFYLFYYVGNKFFRNSTKIKVNYLENETLNTLYIWIHDKFVYQKIITTHKYLPIYYNMLGYEYDS